MGRFGLVLVVCLAASAQTASLSGVVHSADGSALVNAVLSDGHTSVQANSDGTFTFAGLNPGDVTLTVTGGAEGNSVQFSKNFTLLPGQYLNGVELVVPSWGSISGRVTDAAGNPVKGVAIQLQRREYRRGVLQYIAARASELTDEHGVYQFQQVSPAMSYVLSAVPRAALRPTLPGDPKKRATALPITYYPGSLEIDGAQPLILRPGESLGGIDIRLTAANTYCIGGVTEIGNAPGPSQYDVFQEDAEGMIIRAVHSASSDGAGKFILCGLSSGSYRVVAGLNAASQGAYHSAAARVALRDADDRNLSLALQAVPPVTFSWNWDGTPPSPAVSLPVAVSLNALQPGQTMSTQISGNGGQRGEALTDYLVEPTGLPLGYYIKEEIIGGIHARHRPILPWTSVLSGAEIHLTVGRDGATLGGTVTDPSGNPVPETRVLILPGDAVTSADLSAAMLVLAPDTNGQFISSTVAPGKYQVLATASPVVPTPECLAKILRARPGAQEVDVGPSGTTSVKLNPVRLE